MQSEAYARKIKITNLQQMVNTLIYIQEHGYDTREDLTVATSEAHKELDNAQKRLRNLNIEIKYRANMLPKYQPMRKQETG